MVKNCKFESENLVLCKNKMLFQVCHIRFKKVMKRFFSQMLLSLIKLAVKNNSSKKTHKCGQKHTNGGFSSARQNSHERQQNPENFCASGVHVFIVSVLTTRLANSTSQYLICVKNNSMKNINDVFSKLLNNSTEKH